MNLEGVVMLNKTQQRTVNGGALYYNCEQRTTHPCGFENRDNSDDANE